MDVKSGREQFAEMDSKDKRLTKIAQSIIANQIAYDFNHELKFTNVYRHKLKKYLNLLLPELKKCEFQGYDKLANVEEEHTINVYEAMENFLNELKGMMIFDLPYLTEIIKAYKKNPKRLEGIVNKIND